MLKLIVGLGNPGPRYEGTPHNVGFDTLDLLARRIGAPAFVERPRFKAALSDAAIPGVGKVTLMKPLTYMNLSGEAVGAWRTKNGGEPDEILVICDDVNLELGMIRLRPSGSDGGQKGLRSIIQTLGTQQVPRLRLGIRPRGVQKVPDLTSYVLHKWWGTAREVAAEMTDLGAEAAEHLVRTANLAKTMSEYNAQRIDVEEAD